MPPSFRKKRRLRTLGRGVLLVGLGLRPLAFAQPSAKPKLKAKPAAAAAKKELPAPPVPPPAPLLPEPTFEEVLDSPDDFGLNFRFGRAQARRGDLKGALATAERLLLLRPEASSVRLLYAVALYRLDNLHEAQRELELILRSDCSAEIKAEARRYQRLAERRLRRSSLTGRLSAGFEYDTNRNASPASRQRLFSGIPLTLTGDSLRRSDTAAVGAAALEFRHRLASQAGHELFASLQGARVEQTKVDDLDLQAYSARAGTTLRARRWEVTPAAVFDHVLLSQASYLRAPGASLRARRALSPRAGLFTELRGAYQEFLATPRLQAARERSGPEYAASLGADRTLSPAMRVEGEFTHLVKRADREYNAYRREALRLSHAWLLGRGAFLLSTVSAGYDRYQQPDAAISRTRRIDRTLQAGLTSGMPLSLSRPFLRDLTLSGTYEHSRVFSNVTNFSFYSHKLSAFLTYRWSAAF